MRHGVPEIEVKVDLTFLAIAHSDKQVFPANIDYRARNRTY